MNAAVRPRRIVALTATGSALGFGCWFFGLDLWYAIGLGLLLVAVGIAWASLGDADVPDWQDDAAERPAGVRDDVVRLAWSLRTHRGQVHEPAYKRMRALARARLEPHRLDLDDPDDRAAIEALLGAPAYSALHTAGGRLPSLTAVEGCLAAMDALVGDPPPRRPRTVTVELRHAMDARAPHGAPALRPITRPLAALLGRRKATHE